MSPRGRGHVAEGGQGPSASQAETHAGGRFVGPGVPQEDWTLRGPEEDVSVKTNRSLGHLARLC